MKSEGRNCANYYASSPWTLGGTLSEKVELRVNGVRAQVSSNLSFTSAPISLHPGMNEITITAVDAAGNQSVPYTLQAVPTEGTAKP